ncbi:MAG: T6SS phospholipase effector Tle1-like catalytic domain-containing protein [Pseudomonas sp.]|mgnify:CR=1 FL=1|uniref:T6SS phospholipase effector Tle1-like catalytic domain-containing protein n=1 Tax=Pseudomonas sp. TaxID=306 RepID=UPI003D0A9644
MNPSVSSASEGITLHLGLFFDGTGLNLYNQQQGASGLSNATGSYATGQSNVARLYALYPHQASCALAADARHAALALYIEGIGTRCGEADSMLAQATGRHDSGVLATLERVPAQVAALLAGFLQHNPSRTIQTIEIDLFGFSRGAAAARHFANDFDQGPQSRLAKACPGYPLRINFIGLFDTVAAIWAPHKGNFSVANQDFDGLQQGLREGIARQVVQLVAADEWRQNFPLVASDNDILLPGAHTDIGGGYLPEELECLLLERPFSSLEPRNLPVPDSQAWRQASQRLEQQRQAWEAMGLHLRIDCQSVDEPFLAKRDLQRQKRVWARIFGERRVRGELSLVYLRLMHALAVRGAVPLMPVPDSAELALPAELHGIAEKLQAYGLGDTAVHGLDEVQMDLLRRRYIHVSAHWNGPSQANSPLLDGLFVHRPADAGQRVIFPNR